MCPPDTNLQLLFASNLINDGYIFTCTLGVPFVYLTWYDFTLGNSDVLFTASNDNGQAFNHTINLSNNAGNSVAPEITTIGNFVYVTWGDFTPGNEDIFFAESIDNGQAFGHTINLSNNSGQSTNQEISIPIHDSI